MQGTKFFLVFVCSGMLCVRPGAVFFLPQNSPLPRTLCASCPLLFYNFFLLFSSCTEAEFLVSEQRPFTIHKPRQKHFLHSVFNWKWPSYQESTRISSKILFSGSRNSKGKTHLLFPCLKVITGPEGVKRQSCDWTYQLYPLSPSAVPDATFSPTVQAALWGYLSHFYWHPLIPLWSMQNMCRYLEQSA